MELVERKIKDTWPAPVRHTSNNSSKCQSIRQWPRTMWVFGYGSLIWKADFPYEKKVVGYVKGFQRKFCQKSPDHRGLPTRPGRVVTLLTSDNPNEEVWGCAYKIAAENIDSVTDHLDFRERGGYIRKNVVFYPLSYTNCSNSDEPTWVEDKPIHLSIYIAEEDNPNFAGNEDIDTIAEHIVECHGSSGPNTEYLYNLATSMRLIAPGIHDDHLFQLEYVVKQLENKKKREPLREN